MEIDKFIRKLKRNINKNKEFYVHNEEAVKLQIVVPFLGMLGWDFKNPDQVVPEPVISVDKRVKIKLDYLLQIKERNKIKKIGVEVKALGKLNEVAFIRIAKIAKATDIRYIIMTDGDRWELYDLSKPLGKSLIIEWSLLRESSKKVANKAHVIANTKDFGNIRSLSF